MFKIFMAKLSLPVWGLMIGILMRTLDMPILNPFNFVNLVIAVVVMLLLKKLSDAILTVALNDYIDSVQEGK